MEQRAPEAVIEVISIEKSTTMSISRREQASTGIVGSSGVEPKEDGPTSNHNPPMTDGLRAGGEGRRDRPGAARLEGISTGQPREPESIIQALDRPVLFVRRNSYEPGNLPDELRRPLEENRSRLEAAIPAVGRLEVYNHPELHWVGTAWLATRDILVTNRHVAEEFVRVGTDGTYKPRAGIGGHPIHAAVDFVVEHDNPQPHEALFFIHKVVYIEPEGGPDLATADQRP